MRYLSVCSGIEAASVAWHGWSDSGGPLGWEPAGFSEIERFPSEVLAHHYPDVPNFGDMNDYKQWPRSDVDILVGGTPCQSFSVAGLRKGMADPRGNLSLVYCAIADRYSPYWLVWENVPGVLSANRGTDFGSIIGAMVQLGYGVAYRVLDAQYFGVPQRRRRVFVVGCLGGWRRAAEVLFEPESLRRNPPPSREAREEVAGTITSGADRRRGSGQQPESIVPDIASTITSGVPNGGLGHGARSGHAKDSTLIVAPPLTQNPYGDHESREGLLVPSVANPLTARMHKGINTTMDEGQTPIVVHGTQDPCVSEKAFAIQQNNGQENALAFAQNQRDEVRMMDKAGALAAEPGAKQQTYVFKAGQGSKAGSIGGDEDVSPTLSAAESGSNRTPALMQGMAVRRLTPLECERLQGFPDGYTDIPGASDSARYKALGNSMAVPVMRWIGERIQVVHERMKR